MTSGDCTAFIDDVVIYAGCAVSDGTFNQTTLPAYTYQTNPTGSPWSSPRCPASAPTAAPSPPAIPTAPAPARWPTSRTTAP